MLSKRPLWLRAADLVFFPEMVCSTSVLPTAKRLFEGDEGDEGHPACEFHITLGFLGYAFDPFTYFHDYESYIFSVFVFICLYMSLYQRKCS